MISLKNKAKGFTIVELLIVIVVIGILATLVIVTFTGIQQRARNSQRETDVNAAASHIEAFYAQYGYYPTLADMQDTSTNGFLETYMRGLDPEALVDPQGTALAGATSATAYGYTVSGPAACVAGTLSDPTGADTSNNGCDSYSLTATKEGGGTFTKSSNT